MRAAASAVKMSERWLVATTEYAGVTAYTGGIGRHYAALLPALAAQGVEIDLVVFADGDVAARGAPGIRRLLIHPTGRMTRMSALLHRARVVRSVFLGSSYDRVFVPEWMGVGALLPADASLVTNLATGVRLANDVSGLRLRDLPWGMRPAVAVQSLLEARQVRRSTAVIAISQAMAERARALWGPLPPTTVVPNCIDVAAVRRAASLGRLPAGWPVATGPVVLFVGRAERRKGVVDAVDAFERLAGVHPTARLIVAGAGGDDRFEPSRAALLDRLPDRVRSRVTFLGHIAGDELYGAITAADVAMCPSRWEGFGNAAVEVKAAGTPLVVTSGSGFDDFCTDGEDCLMASPGNPDSLARALARTLDDASAAGDRVCRASNGVDRFSPAPIATSLRAAIDELLGTAAVSA